MQQCLPPTASNTYTEYVPKLATCVLLSTCLVHPVGCKAFTLYVSEKYNLQVPTHVHHAFSLITMVSVSRVYIYTASCSTQLDTIPPTTQTPQTFQKIITAHSKMRTIYKSQNGCNMKGPTYLQRKMSRTSTAYKFQIMPTL